MSEAVTWWLTIELIGAIAFPVGFLFFRFLPDRGYGFSKALGLLLLSYLLWIGATAHVIANARWSIVLILVLMAALSAILAVRRRDDLTRFLREHWRYVLVVEGLFAVTFAASLWLRSFIAGSDLTSGEKPMQYAFLNATLRADHFPVQDPWFAGEPLSYYYFGFINMASLMKLTAVPTQIGFNLALGLTIALSAVAMFGLVYNLVATLGKPAHAVVFGIVGVGLLLLVGNLEGFFELWAIHSDGPRWLFDWLGMPSLDGSQSSSEWYPTQEPFWWVRNRHVPTSWYFNETPFWGFQLGDNTTQNIVLPFVLMTMGVAFNAIRSQSLFDVSWIRKNVLTFLLMALIVGALSSLNSWSFPPSLFLLVLAVVAGNWWFGRDTPASRIRAAAGFSVLLAVTAFLLFLPFYLESRGAMWPVVPSEVSLGAEPNLTLITQPKYLFIHWGPLLWLAPGFAAATLSWGFLSRLGVRSLAGLLPGLAPLLIWALLVFRDLGGGGLVEEIETRDANILTIAILIVLVTASTLGCVRALSQRRNAIGESVMFSLASIGTGFLLILGVELFFMRDSWGGARITTMFKLYHHIWIVLSVGAAFGLYYVLFHLRFAGVLSNLGKYLWIAAAAVLLAAGLVFAPAVMFSRTNGFSTPQSLDSYQFSLRRYSPEQYQSVVWLNDHVDGSPVVLQAVLGGEAPWGVSSFTGLPTVLGIVFHETAWRGSAELVQQRVVDVEKAYTTLSVAEAREILEKYDVEYVYVGPFEEARYGEAGLPKFRAFMDVAFQNGEVVIYRTRQERVYASGGQ